MSKQTAVEWYFEKIKSHFEHDGDLFETAIFTYAIAKQKEKEQRIILDDDIESLAKEHILYNDTKRKWVMEGMKLYREQLKQKTQYNE